MLLLHPPHHVYIMYRYTKHPGPIEGRDPTSTHATPFNRPFRSFLFVKLSSSSYVPLAFEAALN